MPFRSANYTVCQHRNIGPKSVEFNISYEIISSNGTKKRALWERTRRPDLKMAVPLSFVDKKMGFVLAVA